MLGSQKHLSKTPLKTPNYAKITQSTGKDQHHPALVFIIEVIQLSNKFSSNLYQLFSELRKKCVIHPMYSHKTLLFCGYMPNAKKYYGIACRKYLRRLAADLTGNFSRARAVFNDVEAELGKHISNSQVGHLVKRFALIATGGELATELGCTGWPPGEARKAAVICFEACLQDWGSETVEARQICEQVQEFFQRYSASRFISKDALEEDVRRIPYLAGYTSNDEEGTGNKLYLVNRQVFKKELCKGISAQKAKEVLGNKGWLLKGSKGWQHQHHIKHRNASDWFYVFGPRVFHGG